MNQYRIDGSVVYTVEPYGESYYDLQTHLRLSTDKQLESAGDTVTLTVSIYDYVGEPAQEKADVQLTINGKKQTLLVTEGVSSITLSGEPFYEVTADAEGRRGAALLIGSKPEPLKPPTLEELARENEKLRKEIARQNADFQAYIEYSINEQTRLNEEQARMNEDFRNFMESVAT
ncbi:hypothetical protein NBRC13296_10255 [Paenibacillus chitinolyticus]|uniref:hypothetical protein n=1 Tax=Paenibacillus chitinolyticus TaxID=79263 RepID=UPI0035569235